MTHAHDGENETVSVSTALARHLRAGIAQAGGWWPFDRFMQAALYEPGLGYYAGGRRIFGAGPALDRRVDNGGSDFTTAPEMSPLFGATLARQVAQWLDANGGRTLWEFGAGTGALAAQLLDALDALGVRVERYTIVDVSGSLQAVQAQRLARFGARVQWASALPAHFDAGVLIGNEVLDAMPVKRLAFDGDAWFERGVAVADDGRFVDADVRTELRPPVAADFVPGTVIELAQQAPAFVATLAERMRGGAAALFIDYGFPEAEFFHPQRTGGTLMCHQGHRSDGDPLVDVGAKDITAHVDFTAAALAAQDAGAHVLGYTSQARFLFNCGLAAHLEAADLRARNAAHRLVAEHEMGELFKVLAFARGLPDGFEAIGFAQGDRTHRL